MKLSYDYFRCHGSECLVREECLRYTELHTGGERTPYCDISTDNPIKSTDDCAHFKPLQEN